MSEAIRTWKSIENEPDPGMPTHLQHLAGQGPISRKMTEPAELREGTLPWEFREHIVAMAGFLFDLETTLGRQRAVGFGVGTCVALLGNPIPHFVPEVGQKSWVVLIPIGIVAALHLGREVTKASWQAPLR